MWSNLRGPRASSLSDMGVVVKVELDGMLGLEEEAAVGWLRREEGPMTKPEARLKREERALDALELVLLRWLASNDMMEEAKKGRGSKRQARIWG